MEDSCYVEPHLEFPLSRTANRFPSLIFSLIYYCLSWTSVISSDFCFPLPVRDIGSLSYFVESWCWSGLRVGLFGSLHSRVTFSNAGVFSRSLDACSAFIDHPWAERHTARSLRGDYMRRAGPVSWDLGTSLKHIKNQLCDYMEKSEPG